MCLSYHIMVDDNINVGRWGLKYWVDGGGLYDYDFLKKIKFKIDEIPITRWNQNKDLSSGVWQQISRKINNLGYSIRKTEKSLAYHTGFNDSRMHPIFRKNNMINTINNE